MTDTDKRVQERAPVDFKVDYLHAGDYILSFSKNISLGGMFLCTDSPPEVGSKLTLVFPVEKFYQAEVPAVVVWVNHDRTLGDVGMGVQFLSSLPTNLKEVIVKYVKRIEILKEFEGYA